MDQVQKREVIFPFSMEVDPMERLMLVNFEKDPDEHYVGFEPQVFKTESGEPGHLIIAWRKDKKIDVYHQKILQPEPEKYRIAGAGLNEMIPVDMEEAFFEINQKGVQAHYRFRDKNQRDVEIKVRESNPAKRKPFGLLAPMGDAATDPPSLPLVLLHDFYFVRKARTDIQVSIAGRIHKIDELPMRMDGRKMTFARYSPKPLIATINPAFSGKWESLRSEMGQPTFEKGDCIYEIDWTNDVPAIQSMSLKNDIHLLSIRFSPSFPCLSAVPANTQLNGRFKISGHASVGSIEGEYTIQVDEDTHIRVTAVPSKGWKPKTTKFSTWFLFTFVRVFKKWPTTYRWDARLYKTDRGSWSMESSWKRTGRIMKA